MSIESELKQVIGNEKVVEDPAALRQYLDRCWENSRIPFCAVRPTTADEVRRVVEWANQSLVPLVAASSTQRFVDGAGGAHGGVVVDMSGMDKILRIDRINRVVMIEPGVTFARLVPEMEREGLRCMMPLCPPGGKSVVAAALERVPITIPRFHTDMSDPLLCVEAVFGTGDVFRTGEAAGPGSIEEQLEMRKAQKWDPGPGQIDIRRIVQGSNGSLGLVTWATLRAEILPKLRRILLFPLKEVSEAVEFVYQMTRRRLGDECLILNNPNIASIFDKGSDMEGLKKKLPPWILIVGISGLNEFPEERVGYQEKDITDMAGRLGLFPRSEISSFKERDFLSLLSGPSEDPYWKSRSKGAFHDLFFLTTLEKVSHFVNMVRSAATEGGCSLEDLGVYIQPIQQGRACQCEFTMFHDSENRADAQRVYSFLRRTSNEIMNEGGFFSIPSPIWAETSLNRDAATREAMRRIKGIFDPNNILNPGFLS